MDLSHAALTVPLSQSERDLLRWRSRRGLLENDIFVQRIFGLGAADTTNDERRQQTRLTHQHQTALTALMDLDDRDLLDVFLSRSNKEAVLSPIRANLSTDCAAALDEVLHFAAASP